ncbi:hypothetical protein [Streptomyces sp. NPDC007991]|uniref:hypothetical protein n=1 Tax=Streptomyces sp. NPDC007991 TaxID=3364803 RepID=UPI0036F0010E
MSADAPETLPEPEIPETPDNDPSQGDDEPGHTTMEDIDADDSSLCGAEGEKVSDGAPEDLEVPVDGDQGTGMPGAEADGDGAPEESAYPIDSGSSDHDESGHATAGDIDAVGDADDGDAGRGEIASAEELAVPEKGAVATRREGDVPEHRAQEDDVALNPPEAAAPTEEAQDPTSLLVETPAQDASESTEAPGPESADEETSSENPIPGDASDQESPAALDQADARDSGEIADAEPPEQALAPSDIDHSVEAPELPALGADLVGHDEPDSPEGDVRPKQPSEATDASEAPDPFDADDARGQQLDDAPDHFAESLPETSELADYDPDALAQGSDTAQEPDGHDLDSDKAESEESELPTDGPEKIEEKVDRPRVEHMYERPLPPSEYGDPINSGGKRIPLFYGPPTREQTAQGSLYDCGVIATLGAVAGHRPDVIFSSIRENGDGTYSVSLHETERGVDGIARPTGRQMELVLTPDLPAVKDQPGVSVLARTEGTAWCALMEKAMAGVDQTWGSGRREEWEARWGEEKSSQGLQDGPTPEGYERLNRGSTSWDRSEMLTQMTGQESAVYLFPEGPDANSSLMSHFAYQLANGKPVLTGSRGLDADSGEIELPCGVVDGHAYEVISVQDERIHLRNPWNTMHPKPLTMDEFVDAFQPKGGRGDYTTLL